MEKTVHSYVLRTKEGYWLGDVYLRPNEGILWTYTDYGNFNIGFGNFGNKDFREFILGLNTQYFAGKAFQSISYICYSNSVRDACNRFAENILPSLQEAIKQENSSLEAINK